MGTELKIELKGPVCFPGLSEDQAREFVNALVVKITESVLDGFISAPAVAQMEAKLDSSGNFAGITQLANSQQVIILHGVGSSMLQPFKGPPSANNPGPGWQLENDLTQRFLAQSGNQDTWTIFYASRVGVLNTISS